MRSSHKSRQINCFGQSTISTIALSVYHNTLLVYTIRHGNGSGVNKIIVCCIIGVQCQRRRIERFRQFSKNTADGYLRRTDRRGRHIYYFNIICVLCHLNRANKKGDRIC